MGGGFFMDERTVKTLKLVSVLALIFAALGAVFFFVYGFSIIWQGLAAGIIIGFLFVACIILLILALFLWIRTMMLQRDLKKINTELKMVNQELKTEKKLNKEK